MANKYTPVFDQAAAEKLAVANSEQSDAANEEFNKDIVSRSDSYLARKYGEEVVANRQLYFDAQVDVSRKQNKARTTTEIIDDAPLTAIKGATAAAGGIAAGSFGLLGALGEYVDPDHAETNQLFKDISTSIAAGTDQAVQDFTSRQSQTLQDKQAMDGLESQLDTEDNLNEYNRTTNNGVDADFIDELAWFGRGTLNNAERILSKPVILGETVLEGVGSLGPSAKVASFAGNVAREAIDGVGKQAMKLNSVKAAVTAHAISPTRATTFISKGADSIERTAIAAGVGFTEAGGVYVSTVNDVLGRSHDELMANSPEYVDLIARNVPEDDAKAQIAANAGLDAFSRQFPQAAALGLLSARFEAAPISSFKGSSFVEGLRAVGVQTFEEGSQGLTGKVSENIAIRDNVDPTSSAYEGIDEEFATGAIAGAGMSGVLGAPSIAASVPRAVVGGLASDTSKRLAAATMRAAATGVDTASKGVSAAANTSAGKATIAGTKAAATKVSETAAPIIESGKERIEDYNTRSDKALQSETLEVVRSIQQLSDAETNASTAPVESVKRLVSEPTGDPVPSGFANNVSEGGSTLQNVQGVLNTFAEKGFKLRNLSDEDTLYAMKQFQNINQIAPDLPTAIKNQVKKLMASQDFKKIQSKAAKIDLSNTTGNSVSTVDAVVKTNPANVNPDEINKLLEQSDRTDLKPEDIKLWKVASRISAAINKRIGDTVEAVKNKNIELQRIADQRGNKPKLEPVPLMDAISRNLAIGELKETSSTNYPSVNEYVRAIFAAGQSATETTLDAEGNPIKGSNIAARYSRFTKHMINKVDALNRSYDDRDLNNKGTPQQFESMDKDGNLVPGNSARASAAITYNANSPKGRAFAKTVYDDAVLVVETHNALVDAFPKFFPEGKLSVSELRGFETQTDLSDTSEPQTPTDDAPQVETETEETPTAVEDPILPQAEIGAEQQPTSEIKDAGVKEAIVAHVNAIFESLGLELKDTQILQLDKTGYKGHASWANDIISLTPDVLNNINSEDTAKRRKARHVVNHEVMHIIDGRAEADPMRTKSMNNLEFDPADGKFYKEVYDASKFKEWKKFFEYALSFTDPETLASELFAEIGAVMLFNPEVAEKRFPEGVKYVKSIIEGQRSRSESSDTTVSDQADTGDGSTSEINTDFEKNFTDKEVDLPYQDGFEIIDMLSQEPGTEEYRGFAQDIMQKLMDKANERLNKKSTPTDEQTIFERILAGEDTTEYRRNKNTMFVRSDGKYDSRLLSIASVAVIDWLSSVRGGDPSRIMDRMDELGIKFSDMNEEERHTVMYGVMPRDEAENLARQIVRMWGREINKDIPMSDARGAVEGLVKELLTSMTEIEFTDDGGDNIGSLISFKLVPYKDIDLDQENESEDKKTTLTKQLMIDVSKLTAIQKDIGLVGQDSIKKMLMPDMVELPSIGAPPTNVDQTQSRGDVPLTKVEKTTLKKMQDTAHIVAESFSSMVSLIGFDNLADYLGRESSDHLAKNHPLKASIDGKNLSIQRDFDDAMQILDSVKNAGFTLNGKLPPVFYRVGVSRVGRHQFKGINPQNNKILRAMITPTHAVLNMTTKKHKDAFWLTVAQGSEISKVENENHRKILKNIQGEFDARFGEAVTIVLDHLNGGTLDGAALMEAMKEHGGSMQQLNTVFAVAQLQKAEQDGTQAEFNTTLSFELDGKTDGPGNMMVNFGQGVLSSKDYTNFKRVGYFLGSKLMTLNAFFGNENSKEDDLYNITAKTGMAMLSKAISEATGDERNQLLAIQNFAAAFGDFKYNPEDGTFEMTRTTAKNPMTKVVYGSSERGVGQGIASDMLTQMYRQLIKTDGIVDTYPKGNEQFQKDFKTLFGTSFNVNNNFNQWFVDKKTASVFEEITTKTLGSILANAAKNTIGDSITEVNDTLVLLTGYQTEFLDLKFNQLLENMANERVSQGKMKTVKKTGKPNMTTMTQRDYDTVISQIREYSPVYANGMQTLDIGAFGRTSSGIRLSSNMDDKLDIAASMMKPQLAGVKVIPYITQGRGDAMMMNRIYSADDAPDRTVPIFDGVDMAIDMIAENAQKINKAVAGNWDANVLQDVVNDVEGFLAKTQGDQELAEKAWLLATIKADKKGSSAADASTVDVLFERLKTMNKFNQARKTVFKRIGVSIDHMGGSGTAYVRGDDREYSFGEINNMITEELNGRITEEDDTTEVEPVVKKKRTPKPKEFSGLVTTSASALLAGLRKETKKKHVRATVELLMKDPAMSGDSRVVLGSIDEVTKWYTENIGPMDGNLISKSGLYDPVNDVMLLVKNEHETIAHELIHKATFNKIKAFYDGDTTNQGPIERLEQLRDEFMDLDYSKENKRVREAALKAQAQILGYMGKSDSFSKAAALNEFMSWTLSNEALMKDLKQRPTGVVERMTKLVKALMRRIMGGVPSDMFSNILFNTELVITDQNTGDTGGNGNGNNNDGNDDGGLTPIAHNFSNFWIDLVKERLEKLNNTVTVGTQAARRQFNRYRADSQNAVDALDFGGFNLSAYQKETFRAIHTVLAMEIRLNPQPSVALNDLFKFITDNLTPEMFGPNNAQDRYSTIMELFGGTKNDEEVSDAIAVLLALSQTSDGFRRALDQLPRPPKSGDEEAQSLNDFLSVAAANLMNSAVGSVDISKKDLKDTLDEISENILVQESENEFRALAKLMQSIDKADEYMSGGFKKLAGYTKERNQETQASDRSKMLKLLSNTVTAASSFLVEDEAKIMANSLKEVTHMGHSLDWAVPLREFITESIGTDETNGKLVALLDRTNYAQQNVRQNYREDLPVILQNAFENHPNEEQWKAGHHVLGKTDFATIFDANNVNSSFRMISDEGYLDKRISQTEDAIRANMSTAAANDVMAKGQQLADFMNDKGAGLQLLTNAELINRLSGGYEANMTSEIDKLISMYALKGSDPQMRIMITQMYQSDPVGVTNLVTYTQALNKEEELKVVDPSAKLNGYKGFIPDHAQSGSKLVIESDDKRAELERAGYKRVADATADEEFSMISRGYYTTTTKQTGTYSQGVMQTVQDSYRGVNSLTGLSVNGKTSGVIAGSAADYVVDQLADVTSVRDNKEALIPRFMIEEETGNIVVRYYERALNPDLINKYQNPKSNMALMLGVWAGRQVEEKFAQKYNDELVTELKRIYDEREDNQDGLYVNLVQEKKDLAEYNAASASQKKRMRKPDQIFVDSWNVISPRSKEKIKEVFGPGEFWVRKDQMNLALGYRDPSIIDMWTGNSRMPEAVRESVQAVSDKFMGKSAMSRLAAFEGAMQGVVSTAKDIIVVRSLVVPYMNVQANVFQLQNRGVGTKRIWKALPDKLSEIEEYNKNVKRMIELETQIQLAGTDANRVAILQQQMDVIVGQNARMSIAPLIGAGAYKNIAEGITELDVDITSGRIGDWIENQVEKLPTGIQTVAKYGILSKDTALYKGANKAVQYGDFIAKAIYYDHLTNEKGFDHDGAMKLVNEEFVNFSVLPGRTRQYMEGMGASWFLTFKIRIMKIAMNQIRNNPARSLIVNSFGVDGPIGDNLATVIADDRIGYSLGWEMLFGATSLNPWLNVTDWNN